MKNIEEEIEDQIKGNAFNLDLDLFYTYLLEAGYTKEQISNSSFRKLMEQSLLLKNHKDKDQNRPSNVSPNKQGEDRSIPDIDAFELPDEY